MILDFIKARLKRIKRELDFPTNEQINVEVADPAYQRWKDTVKMEKKENEIILSTPLEPGNAMDLITAKHHLEGQDQRKKYIRGLSWVMRRYR